MDGPSFMKTFQLKDVIYNVALVIYTIPPPNIRLKNQNLPRFCDAAGREVGREATYVL